MHIQSAIEALKEHAKTDVLELHSGASEAALKEFTTRSCQKTSKFFTDSAMVLRQTKTFSI